MRFCALLLGLLVSGCASPGQNRPQSAATIYQDNTIKVVATHLTVDELNRRYGKPNPFVAPQLLLTRFELLVFELSISAILAPIRLERAPIRIDFGGVRTSPQSESELKNIWERFTIDDDVSTIEVDRGRDHIRRQLLVERAAIANTNEMLRGIVVFQGSFPSEGTAIIELPYMGAAGASTATLEVELTTLETTSPLCIFCP